MADKVNNLQDMFLNNLRRSKTPVTMFLVKGVKLQGIITWFDNFSVLLRRDGQAQLIYKHAISTIMPAQPLDLGEIERAFADRCERKKPALLQEVFLGAVRRSRRAGHDVPRQRRDASGRDRRLRSVLHAAPARRPVAARLQACHLDGAAGASDQLRRARTRSRRLSVFDRVDDEFSRGARAVVALPELGGEARRDVEARLDEAAGLAEAIGIDVADRLHFQIRAPQPATLFGSGQVEPIADAPSAAEAELLIVDAPITPIQQKNLETATKAKVIDRTGLILEIFGERAATAEGRLQVELAHLDYQAGRLVRQLDPPRAAARRLRLPRRPRRNPDRGRPPADPRPHGQAEARSWSRSRRTRGLHRARAPAGAVAGDRAGRLHQCRQIDPVQPARPAPT